MYASQTDELPSMTEAEYLVFADAQDIKHEYSKGHVYAMSGASVRHNTIIANVITHLNILLADRDCTVTSSDTRIHITEKESYRYPDVTVFCGEADYWAGRSDTITNPLLLVEVLSPSTALTDRNEKLVEYTQIKHLQAYVLVAQDEPKIEIFRRHEADKWLYEYAIGLDSTITAPILSSEITLSLVDVYRRIRWK